MQQTQTHHATISSATRAFLVLCVAMITLAATAPPTRAAPPERAISIAQKLKPADYKAQAILIVHYIRPDGDYSDWNLWTWTPGEEGRAVPFSRIAGPARYVVIPVPLTAKRQGFIIRRGNWQAKDVGQDRFATLESDRVTEIWLVSADPRIYTNPADIDLKVRLKAAFLDTASSINLATSAPLDPDDTAAATITRDGVKGGKLTYYQIESFRRSPAKTASSIIYQIDITPPVDPNDVAALSLSIPDRDPITIFAANVLTEPQYTPLDAQLGATYTPESTTFRVWSPVSSAVELLLFDSPTSPDPSRTIQMTRAAKGVWQATVQAGEKRGNRGGEDDLHATPYQYRYTSYNQTRTGPDIYARAATSDSSRSVVVDLTRTNPDRWDEVTPPIVQDPTDELIYEVHVRDFTIADHSLDKPLRGTYRGLIHEGEVAGVNTGLAHLRELGVTAVHLMPVHDFTAAPDDYNWGYWTALFNVPESNYSTDPNNPIQAITDLKAAIAGLHDAGIRVILDVVYNHTSSSFEHSPFDNAVPWYYFRTSIDGQLQNDAGVGNSIADERPMARKYITDSAAYWVTQYRIDGLRFDLLGTHHPQTVKAICQTLSPIRRDLTIYGEPWTGGGPVHFPKGAQRNTCFAVFNDNLRNAIRGDLDGTSTGFATGPGGDRGAIQNGVSGARDFAAEPTEAINYVSAHDNLTLWDKISKANPTADARTKQAMHKLALGMVLTSQGVPFLHAGSDFARTKGGNHNSYNAGDEVNAIDWVRKDQFKSIFKYTQGLAKLRAEHPAFRIADDDVIKQHLRFIHLGTPLAYKIEAATLGDSWHTILVAYNGEPARQYIRLPDGFWNLVVNDKRAGTKTIRKVSGIYWLAPYSMFVGYQ